MDSFGNYLELSLGSDLEGAETNFLASLEWGRKSWNLGTSTSLGRLWQSRAKRQDADHLLALAYSRFTEGFDARDLQDAKSLLTELA